MDSLAVLALGLFLGLRHATDADHVVAVTAIAARYRKIAPAALVGAVWGVGHSLTICLVGGAIVLFNLSVPPRVGLSLEFAVGIALAVVGALNLFGRGGFLATNGFAEGRLPSARAFGLGVIHGLAGSAAVALLVLATVRDPRTGLVYLAVFSLGTVLGMVLVTLGIAAPVRLFAARWPGFGAPLRVATGALSLAFGGWILWQVGVVDGLFGANPSWDPH
jgi:high-affinity nickel-transport protein